MKNKVNIKQIIFNSSEYKQELELRDKILRKPLGLTIYDENLKKESNDYHIGGFYDNKLIGILILTKIDDKVIKIRQVAVDEVYRGNNIGKELVIYSEEFAKKLGYKKIVLNARKLAVNFYKKLGYEVISDEFLEISIPHYKMQKYL